MTVKAHVKLSVAFLELLANKTTFYATIKLTVKDKFRKLIADTELCYLDRCVSDLGDILKKISVSRCIRIRGKKFIYF